MFTGEISPIIDQAYTEYLDGTVKYVISSNDGYLVSQSEVGLSGKKLSLLGSEKKFLIKIEDAFFHSLLGPIAAIWREHKIDSNTFFVIDERNVFSNTKSQNKNIQTVYSLFFDILDRNNIRYSRVRTGPNLLYLEIDNFYHLKYYQPGTSVQELREIADIFLDRVGINKNISPTRKLYLTRREAEPEKLKNLEQRPVHITAVDDTRIMAEELVEYYFRSLGFEIVVPEDFDDFEDQIKYMASAKIIASSTSSGLLNSLFMNDGSTMLELLTPLYRDSERVGVSKTLHTYYIPVAYVKKHLHISIPHDRSPSEIISAIEGNSYLKELLKG